MAGSEALRSAADAGQCRARFRPSPVDRLKQKSRRIEEPAFDFDFVIEPTWVSRENCKTLQTHKAFTMLTMQTGGLKNHQKLSKPDKA